MGIFRRMNMELRPQFCGEGAELGQLFGVHGVGAVSEQPGMRCCRFSLFDSGFPRRAVRTIESDEDRPGLQAEPGPFSLVQTGERPPVHIERTGRARTERFGERKARSGTNVGFGEHSGLCGNESIKECLEIEIVCVAPEEGHGQVRMRVDEARHHDAAAGVDPGVDGAVGGDAVRKDLNDHIIGKHDRASGDHLIAGIGGHDGGIGDRRRRWHCAGHGSLRVVGISESQFGTSNSWNEPGQTRSPGARPVQQSGSLVHIIAERAELVLSTVRCSPIAGGAWACRTMATSSRRPSPRRGNCVQPDPVGRVPGARR